ncbi:MAG TPA: hypothetical protein VI300_22955 [Solirubrobacter sp.]
MKPVVASLVALIAAITAPAAARAATTPLLWTIAGVESTGAFAPSPCAEIAWCDIPARWPRAWTATDRRIGGSCLARLADGTLVLCQGPRLLALDRKGRLARWPQRTVSLDLGDLVDADAAADGGLVVLGEAGVARVRPDATVDWRIRSSSFPFGAAVAALQDGGALVADATEDAPESTEGSHLLRIRPDGTREVLVRNLPHARHDRGVYSGPDDLAALPDGSAVVAQSSQERVLRVDTAGHVTVLAGGGHGFREGGRATAAGLGVVNAVGVGAGGRVVAATERGLFSISSTGTIHRIALGAEDAGTPADPRALTTDGRRASAAMLTGVRRIEVLRDGTIAALAEVDDHLGTRVALVAPVGRGQPLAVALPASNRTSLRDGNLDVIVNHAATARVTLLRDRRVIARVHASLGVGRTRLHIRLPQTLGTYTARVTATGGHGELATHRLVFISQPRLSVGELGRLIDAAERWGSGGTWDLDINACTPVRTDAFRCRWTLLTEDGRSIGPASFELRPDGLIRYTAEDRHGRIVSGLLLEPR